MVAVGPTDVFDGSDGFGKGETSESLTAVCEGEDFEVVEGAAGYVGCDKQIQVILRFRVRELAMMRADRARMSRIRWAARARPRYRLGHWVTWTPRKA